MKRIKLKLSFEELRSLHGLCQHYTQRVEPATERLRNNGHLGQFAVERMQTSILCQRAAIMLAKVLVQPQRLYYRISVPPEYGCAVLLAYWTYYADMQPDVLLEAMFHDIHQQLA